MKASELKEMIRQVVAEEIKRQLPVALSEMYIKRLVSEQTTVAAPPQFKKRNSMSITEALLDDDEQEEEQRPVQKVSNSPPKMTREALRERLRSQIADDPLLPFLESVDPSSVTESGGDEGIPLESLGMNMNFGGMAKLAGISEQTSSRGSVPETPEMKMKKLEEKRRQLDSIKVG